MSAFSNKIIWVALLVISYITFTLYGLPQLTGYEGYGTVFWAVGTVVTTLIFCLIPLWISGRFFKKKSPTIRPIIIVVVYAAVMALMLGKV